jgi:hypothetical protein
MRPFRRFVLASSSLALAAFVAAACSGGSNAAAPGDAGTDANTSPSEDAGAARDANAPDAGQQTDSGPPASEDAGSDAGPACLQIASPTKIGNDTSLIALTTDGYALSLTPSGWDATPLDGGATKATGIPANPIDGGIGWAVLERVLVIADSNGNLIDTWTAGGKSTGAPIPFGQGIVASSDGQHLVTVGGDGSVRYAKSDLTGEVTLQPAPDSGSNCSAFITFAADNYVVVASFCQTTSDAGLVPLAATITSYSLPNLTPTLTVPNAQVYFSADAAGTKILAITTAGAASVYPLDGSPSTSIDTDVFNGFLTPDGSTVIYTTTAGQLKRTATSNPVPTTLVASGAYDLLGNNSWMNDYASWLPALPPDGSQVFTCTNDYCLTGSVGFASTTTAGVVTTVMPADQVYGQDLFYDPFTHNGAYALVRQDPTSIAAAAPVLATPAGGTPKTIATASTRFFAGPSGALVVYDDNFTNNASDLYVADLASSCTPTLVAAGISSFWLTPGRDQIVYAKGGMGLFVVPVP